MTICNAFNLALDGTGIGIDKDLEHSEPDYQQERAGKAAPKIRKSRGSCIRKPTRGTACGDG